MTRRHKRLSTARLASHLVRAERRRRMTIEEQLLDMVGRGPECGCTCTWRWTYPNYDWILPAGVEIGKTYLCGHHRDRQALAQTYYAALLDALSRLRKETGNELNDYWLEGG